MLAPNSPIRRLVALVLAGLVVTLGVAACGSTSTGAAQGSSAKPGSTARPGSVPTPADAASLAPATPVSTLPTMPVAQLPQQGVDTLRLIAKGGPYPYSKDGVTFSNREGLLPKHPSGWYQEYTVVTPGSNDRGARRIIGGRSGERYYTDDHYESFRELLSGVQT